MDREKHVMMKVMAKVLPLLFISTLVSMIDRANVGFAAINMNQDLGLSSTAFGFGAGIFFVTYVIFEVPSNLILAKVGARRWIARIMLSWGIISAATAFVVGPKSFYAARALLGLAEAGFIPGVLYYLAFWFPSAYRGRVIGVLMTAMPAAFLLGSPLSGALMSMNGVAGLKGWQWLFILEGAPAIFLGMFIYFRLPDKPDSATFLTLDESKWLSKRLLSERYVPHKKSLENIGFVQRDLGAGIFALGSLLFCISIVNYSLGFFLPQIIKAFGISDFQTGMLAAMPYIVGLAAVVAGGYLSDRTGDRRSFLIGTFVIGGAFLCLSTVADGLTLKVAAFSLAAVGTYGCIPAFWAYTADFLERKTDVATAAAIAAVNSIANLAGFLGPLGVGYLKDRTQSFNGSLLAMSAASILGITILLLLGNPTPSIGLAAEENQK